MKAAYLSTNGLRLPALKEVCTFALTSWWLPVFLFASGYLTGLLLPTIDLGKGYTSRTSDFISAFTLAALLVASHFYIQRHTSKLTAKTVFIAMSAPVLGAFITVFGWAYVTFGATHPDDLEKNKFGYIPGAFGQIMIFKVHRNPSR